MGPGEHYAKRLLPGSLSLPSKPSVLEAVVTSGAVVCAHDKRTGKGGMAHYCRAYREKGVASTARYAMPAIVGLVRLMEREGSHASDLSAHLIGGASNAADHSYEKGLAEENIKVGLELLDKLGLGRVAVDTGGRTARQVRFETDTGNVSIGAVSDLPSGQWYPCRAKN